MNGYDILKRCEESDWTLTIRVGPGAEWFCPSRHTSFAAGAITGDDWEIQEKVVGVTRAEVESAMSTACSLLKCKPLPESVRREIINQLGLGY